MDFCLTDKFVVLVIEEVPDFSEGSSQLECARDGVVEFFFDEHIHLQR